MAVDRPTFSESWYRVAGMRPRVRTSLRTYRQHFRGQTFHVVEDPGTNDFYRLNEHTYQFVGLLDGKRKIADAWAICNDTMGDLAPTQPEVIQVLANLYQMNLLEAEITPDVAGMFDRFRKRRAQEARGKLMNILFLRIPLINPNRFLDRWINAFGWLFSKWGVGLWLVLLAVAFSRLVGHGEALFESTMGVLSPANLPILGVCFAITKIIHEFGHAFACKKFGRDAGTGGQVHTMGIMFLVLMPFPYIDATSAWGYRNKWHRAFVGAAGMYVEIGFAAIAAICWSFTTTGTFFNAVCYNVMFIASVATILFNANPLIRFDGYFILCDILELPNLMQQAQGYLKYLFKRYAYGIKRAHNTATTFGQRFWYFVYGHASIVYRFFIITSISLFVADQLFFIGPILAVMTMTGFIVAPVFKFAKYLFTAGELQRHRVRAMSVTAMMIGAVLVFIAGLNMPDYVRSEGVVDSIEPQVVRVQEGGFVVFTMSSGQSVGPNGQHALIQCENVPLVQYHKRLLAKADELEAHIRLARTQDPTSLANYKEMYTSVLKELAHVERRLAELTLYPTVNGTWVSPNVDQFRGQYVQPGDPLGMVADLKNLRVRVAADQYVAARLREEVAIGSEVEMRVKGRPDLLVKGRVERIGESAMTHLLTPALGYAGGGEMPIDPTDPEGLKTSEPYFEVVIVPGEDGEGWENLRNGQVVVARFATKEKRLVVQWYRSVRQLLQQRFQI